MKKTVTALLVVLLVLALLLCGMIFVPRILLGIDIFDQSGWTEEQGFVQYLDYFGKPITGWQSIGGKWYHFDPEDGSMTTGWLEEKGKHYYLASDGTRKDGWLHLPDGTYYLDPRTAAAVTGWTQIDGNTYYLSQAGRISTGLTEVDGKTYFLGSDGIRRSGWVEDGGQRYLLDENGIITTGWADTEYGRCYFLPDGTLGSGWTDTDQGRYFLTDLGTVATGWLDTEDGLMYLDEAGKTCSGWVDTDLGRAYLSENSIAATGWLELEDNCYYFHENGIMAMGKVILEEKAYYFDSHGRHVYFVNNWNPLPEDYEVELVAYGKYKIAAHIADDLDAMLKALDPIGYYKITSIYRTKATQEYLWDKYYQEYRNAGNSKDEALRLTALRVAVPGTSEHHLGLAVDISSVETVKAWLAEHSWEYGFIVRYPEGKTDITGIQYEPWHYRYVGRELAKELYDLGLCLEEYMDMLTERAGSDAGTASNPEA